MLEPFPFDVCEQLLLSDCKMHLIIVYSEAKKTKKMLSFLFIWSWDCRVHDHNPETLIMYQSCCRAHSHTSGWFLKENPREYFTCDLQECFMLSSKAFAALFVQILKFRWCSLCFKKKKVLWRWDHSTSGGTADLFVFDQHAPCPTVVCFCSYSFWVAVIEG